MSVIQRREPAPLSVKITDWERKTKIHRTINDEVESIHILLLSDDNPDPELRDTYCALLNAVWPEQCVEGSTKADDIMAAKIIRDKAIETNALHPLRKEKLATIAKALNIALRRYGNDRNTRRMTVDGELVSNDSSNND